MERSPRRIGFSGHQQLGDEAAVNFVKHSLRTHLETYQRQAQQHGQDVIACSALAMGADQVFAQTALDLHIPIEAVIPCAQYSQSFPSAEVLAEYQRLLACCHVIHRLPTLDCSDDAYLVAGRWIVDHTDLILLAWNGLPPKGRGGTGDIAHYARQVKRPFIHIHPQRHTITMYGDLSTHTNTLASLSPKQEFIVTKQTVYQGPIITVNQYQLRMPNGKEITRDIVERPESVLVLPIAQQEIVLLVEEYDLGAGVWQLTLPGGKVEDGTPEGVQRQAEIELRQEIGYKARSLEKLLTFYSHPGYIAHKVHLFIAQDLEWDPLEGETQEEIRVQTFTLKEALAATRLDYRFDPEAALALWLYAGNSGR